MLTLFASAFGLGIAFSAPPGPVSAEVWRRGLAGGLRPAFLVGAGSLIGDAAWAAIALTGAAFVVESDAGRLTLGIVGSAVLLTLALKALAAAHASTAVAAKPRHGGHFATGAAISLGNPYAIAFWVGVGSGLSGTVGAGRLGLAVFFGGFMLAAFLWALAVAALVAFAHRHTGAGFNRAANLVAAVVLAFFGVELLLRTV